MEQIETDILVAGGGIAGLAAAARLAADGAHVVVVDPAPLGTGDDLRTTAFLQPAIDTLARAGAWEAMEPASEPLWTMRLIDAGGQQRQPRAQADFEARETLDRPFGRNVPNAPARAALEARLAELPNVTQLRQTTVTGHVAQSTRAVVRLSTGQTVSAALVVAADGRDSTLRGLAGITARRWHYGQKALVFAVHHPEPHGGVSTEIHSSGGPCTLVPMPDRDGRPCSSVVWMVPGERAEALAALDPAGLGTALTAETMGLFGPLEVIGRRAVWPIIGQIALRLDGPRLALVAESAHVIPPIGAQGLNISLADIECLAGLVAEARAAGRDIGDVALLRRYHLRRWPEMAARVAGVDALNRMAQTGVQPLKDLRRMGLQAVHRIAPLRRLAMRIGMGA